jgi:hypothetical protein
MNSFEFVSYYYVIVLLANILFKLYIVFEKPYWGKIIKDVN